MSKNKIYSSKERWGEIPKENSEFYHKIKDLVGAQKIDEAIEQIEVNLKNKNLKTFYTYYQYSCVLLMKFIENKNIKYLKNSFENLDISIKLAGNEDAKKQYKNFLEMYFISIANIIIFELYNIGETQKEHILQNRRQSDTEFNDDIDQIKQKKLNDELIFIKNDLTDKIIKIQNELEIKNKIKENMLENIKNNVSKIQEELKLYENLKSMQLQQQNQLNQINENIKILENKINSNNDTFHKNNFGPMNEILSTLEKINKNNILFENNINQINKKLSVLEEKLKNNNAHHVNSINIQHDLNELKKSQIETLNDLNLFNKNINLKIENANKEIDNKFNSINEIFEIFISAFESEKRVYKIRNHIQAQIFKLKNK